MELILPTSSPAHVSYSEYANDNGPVNKMVKLRNPEYPEGSQLFDVRYYTSPSECFEVIIYNPLTKKLEVKADIFSKSAKEKIEKAGGKAIVLCECQEAKAE